MSLQSRFKDDSMIEIGVDEAGRGSVWGPIVAGATIIPPESEWTDEQRELMVQLRDSKKISPKKRDKLYEQIKELLPYFAVGIVGADEINLNGIQWANREAFRRAIYGIQVEHVETCRLLVDGTLPLDKWSGEQEVIVEGDNQYMAIAASSILAKVEHDRWIQDYCAFGGARRQALRRAGRARGAPRAARRGTDRAGRARCDARRRRARA